MFQLIESYFSVFMLLGASAAALSILLLIKPHNKPWANHMLALLSLTWGFSCYWFFAFIQGPPFYNLTVTSFIGPMMPLTLFPPIYLYVKYLFHEYRGIQKKDHLHFLPIYLYAAFTLYLFLINDASVQGMRSHSLYPWRSMISSWVAMIQGPFYFFKVKSTLKFRRQKLMEEFSDIESRKLSWLSNINAWFLPIFLIGGISAIIRSTHLNPYMLYMAYHGVMCFSLVYIHMAIYKNPELFTVNTASKKFEFIPLALKYTQKETQTSSNMASNNREEEIVQKLVRVMEKEKLFKKPGISLNELCMVLQESRNAVSSVLNNNLRKSFYDYINELRIQESKLLLTDPHFKPYTVEAIALEAGFKSLSVFYRLFKDAEKITPTEFRRRNT